MKIARGGLHTNRVAGLFLSLAAAGLAGCVAAGPSVPAGPSQSGLVSHSGWPTQEAGLTDVPSQSANASERATDTISSAPLAPAGVWTSVNWGYLGSQDWVGSSASMQVFGWSRGYVGFAVSPPDGTSVQGDSSVVPYSSSDGLHWTKGQALNTAVDGVEGLTEIRSVLEGPSGLLAVGWTGACASEFLDGLWTSSDGKTWHPINLDAAFGKGWLGGIASVSGGSAGFTAVAFRGAGVWTSADGATWHSLNLGLPVFSGAKVNDGTAFSGGYVLAGTDGNPDCTASVRTEGSTPAPPPSKVAAAWWSGDGATWTHMPLPGAPATPNAQSVWTCRLSDQAVMVVDDVDQIGRSAWVSGDGRNWTRVNVPTDIGPEDIVTDGRHGLVVTADGDPTQVTFLTLQSFDSHYGLFSVRETGPSPAIAYLMWPAYGSLFGKYGHVAIGPTGVLVTDGMRLWIGLPSSISVPVWSGPRGNPGATPFPGLSGNLPARHLRPFARNTERGILRPSGGWPPPPHFVSCQPLVPDANGSAVKTLGSHREHVIRSHHQPGG